MEHLNQASLLDFCNPAVKNDQVLSAIAKALDPQLQTFVSTIVNNQIFCALNNQPESILDFLAIYHFNVDYYDLTLPVPTKLLLIQNCISDKINKGTPSRILQILNSAFGYSELIEWFNDTPVRAANTFRIQIADPLTDPIVLNNAYRAVLKGKNVRSYFAGFSSFNTASWQENVTPAIGQYDFQVIRIAQGFPLGLGG